jgi:hypothetical protein
MDWGGVDALFGCGKGSLLDQRIYMLSKGDLLTKCLTIADTFPFCKPFTKEYAISPTL